MAPAFDHLRIENIDACSIFYCFRGRNAWHSTWSTRYSENCMHPNFNSAQLVAEQGRQRGSVFYIELLPALMLKSRNLKFLITQINENKPLGQYSANALREWPDEDVKRADRRDNYLTFGASIRGALGSFAHNSRFWATRQPERDSIIVLYADDGQQFEPLSRTKSVKWASKSIGKYYYLNWKPVDSHVGNEAIQKLSKKANLTEN